MPWYALHCRSCTEAIVVDRLAVAGIEAFYPHTKRKSADGKRDVEVKFFPGYVFANFEYVTEARAVIEIPHVVQILGWGRTPIAIPDLEIEAVRLVANTPNVKAVSDCPYVATGDRVQIQHGPLRGLEGFVVYTKSAARVIISVTMLKRSIAAEVDIVDLTLARPALVVMPRPVGATEAIAAADTDWMSKAA